MAEDICWVASACDPANFEPNLALSLEIADLINSRKGNAPREAAMAIVGYINSRNPHVSILALGLLDMCVKNCGYPFHLQVSTKDFLNELVRRFPERPPVRATRVQMKILEVIEEWHSTICQTSRYKEDLGFIRDMHRLLLYKGYVFPELRREDAAVLNPSDALQSVEEMEAEERAAQSAKLQELIRRGSPRDLQEANRLMKIMAGYDTKNKTNWRAKAAEEVGKVQQKARLLEEMLERHQPEEKLVDGDIYSELANALQNAQPKIQKMCEEESDDTEAVNKLFVINDSLNHTLQRYQLVKKGDLDGARQIPRGTLGTKTALHAGKDNELSLIDLEAPEDESTDSSISISKGTPASRPSDDLISLSLGPVEPRNNGIYLGMSQPEDVARTSTAEGGQTSTLPPRFPTSPTAIQPPIANDTEEWTFTSALPPTSTLPPTAEVLIEREDVSIQLSASRRKHPLPDRALLVVARIQDRKPQGIGNLTFQVAVPKGKSLQLEAQSGRDLLPLKQDAITQAIKVMNVENGQAESLRMRWRLSYRIAGVDKEEQGEIQGFGIS